MDGKTVVIYERLKLLNEYIGDLQQLQPVSFDTYQENKLIRRTVEHDYAHIDDAAVFGILRNRLGDFTAFAQAIVAQSDTYGEEE